MTDWTDQNKATAHDSVLVTNNVYLETKHESFRAFIYQSENMDVNSSTWNYNVDKFCPTRIKSGNNRMAVSLLPEDPLCRDLSLYMFIYGIFSLKTRS